MYFILELRAFSCQVLSIFLWSCSEREHAFIGENHSRRISYFSGESFTWNRFSRHFSASTTVVNFRHQKIAIIHITESTFFSLSLGYSKRLYFSVWFFFDLFHTFFPSSDSGKWKTESKLPSVSYLSFFYTALLYFVRVFSSSFVLSVKCQTLRWRWMKFTEMRGSLGDFMFFPSTWRVKKAETHVFI